MTYMLVTFVEGDKLQGIESKIFRDKKRFAQNSAHQ